jgi:hypothetical protein
MVSFEYMHVRASAIQCGTIVSVITFYLLKSASSRPWDRSVLCLHGVYKMKSHVNKLQSIRLCTIYICN